jgi:hypothetical protein
MTTMSFEPRSRDLAKEGAVARLSAGGWGLYHRMDCRDAPHMGEDGVRAVIHGPWRYLAAHWRPCPVCRPPADDMKARAA